MADKNTVTTSGAPEETGQPVWDSNNKLVDPELKEHFATEADKVLGKRDAEGKEIEAGSPVFRFGDGTTPAENQATEDQTADPVDSPRPSFDFNTRPTTVAPTPERFSTLESRTIPAEQDEADKQRAADQAAKVQVLADKAEAERKAAQAERDKQGDN